MQLEDRPNNRMLDGSTGLSTIDSDEYARIMFDTGEFPDPDIYRTTIRELHKLSENGISVMCSSPNTHEPYNDAHTDDEFDLLLNRLVESQRFDEQSDIHHERLTQELVFFDESRSIRFLLDLEQLIKKFMDDGVVWGVGRGSSCASFVLYLMHVHDIDPTQFDIDFKEFSKKDEEE